MDNSLFMQIIKEMAKEIQSNGLLQNHFYTLNPARASFTATLN